MAKASANAVAPVKEQNGLPATEGFGAFDGIGSGYENVTARDLLIPRITILQGNSPQVTMGKPEYDQEARAGDIYDVGLKQRFPKGIIFLPVFYQKQWLEWAPRESGKGLQGIHDEGIMAKTTKHEESGRAMLPNGNYIMETAQFYGLNMNADMRKSFLPMASTQLKKARFLMTLATSEKLTRGDGSQFTAPLFYRAYSFGVVPESNNKGAWIGWKIDRAMALPEIDNWEQLLADIKEFRESLAAGTVKGDIAAMEEEHAGQTIDGDASPM